MTQTREKNRYSKQTAAIQEEIISTALRSYERLPLLEVVMDRVAQGLGPALRGLLAVKSDVVLHSVEYVSCGEALSRAPDPGIVALATAAPWNGPVAVTLEPDLLFAALEIMLGAPDTPEDIAVPRDPSIEGAQAMPKRPFTVIEKRLGGSLVALALTEVERAFAPLEAVNFAPGPVESGPKDILLAPAAAGCALATFTIWMHGRGGCLAVIIPHKTLESLRTILAQPRTAGQLGDEFGWKNLLSETLTDTPVNLKAVLHERVFPLSEVLNWQPGKILKLGIDADQDVTIRCSGKDMFRAATGRRKNGAVALRVTAELDGSNKENASGPGD